MDRELDSLFRQYTGESPVKAEKLTGAGSNRSYWRLTGTDGMTLIGVRGTNVEENRAFLAIDSQLLSKGIRVPKVFAVSDDSMCYLQQDLGDTQLFSLLEDTRHPDGFEGSVMTLLEKTVAALPDIQFKGAEGMDFSRCFPCPSFDRRSIMWDLNYFKYCFLKGTGIEFHESLLENDFEHLADILLEEGPWNTFMFRDFQARNVMIKDGCPWFIDFQGGRRGPIEYDLASFIGQARAAYPLKVRRHLTEVYLESLSRYRNVDRKQFERRLDLFTAMRTLQVLGAYGYRGFFERKSHFLLSIPSAIRSLSIIMPTLKKCCPYLSELLSQVSDLPRFHSQETFEGQGLTVHVCSFSYRQGIPADESGNGGGFVFDCRGMHNPGLHAEYRDLTGNDDAVIDFLEQRGEVQPFLQAAYEMVDASVRKYLERGYTSLTVCFGCTGGHHRSVYCANHMAAHLSEKFQFQAAIVLEHRELGLRILS